MVSGVTPVAKEAQNTRTRRMALMRTVQWRYAVGWAVSRTLPEQWNSCAQAWYNLSLSA